MAKRSELLKTSCNCTCKTDDKDALIITYVRKPSYHMGPINISRNGHVYMDLLENDKVYDVMFLGHYND
jgi:hypothetical protein